MIISAVFDLVQKRSNNILLSYVASFRVDSVSLRFSDCPSGMAAAAEDSLTIFCFPHDLATLINWPVTSPNSVGCLAVPKFYSLRHLSTEF